MVYHLTKAIAIENAKFNISANVISPGGIMTERFINLIKLQQKKKKNFNKKLLEVEKSIPAKRVGRPDEIANAIVFLSSDLGGYINGIDLSVMVLLPKAFSEARFQKDLFFKSKIEWHNRISKDLINLNKITRTYIYNSKFEFNKSKGLKTNSNNFQIKFKSKKLLLNGKKI